MVKFLLCLPLALFVIALMGVIIVLGGFIYAESNADPFAADSPIGDWSFWQVVLGMAGVVGGGILAGFVYAMVVLKPVFNPPSPEIVAREKALRRQKRDAERPLPPPAILAPAPARQSSAMPAAMSQSRMGGMSAGGMGAGIESIMGGNAGAQRIPPSPRPLSMYQSAQSAMAESEHEPEPRSRKGLVITLIVMGVVAALVVAGIIFREQVADFADEHLGFLSGIFGVFRSDDDDDTNGETHIIYEEHTVEQEYYSVEQVVPEPAPAAPEGQFPDVMFGWMFMYPAGLTLNHQPIDAGSYRIAADTETQIIYWSAENSAGYADASAFAEFDTNGFLEGANAYTVLSDNVVISRFDGTDAHGNPAFAVRWWQIEHDGIASAEIASATPERADEWYAILQTGALRIERGDAEPPEAITGYFVEIDEPEGVEWEGEGGEEG